MSWFTPIKRSIPHAWKVGVQAQRRQFQDKRSGIWSQFATPATALTPNSWQAQIHIAQALKPSSYAENKWHNLAMAMQQLEPVIIRPGQIFSFWHAVGEPNTKRGYRAGRALMNNKLKAVVGGGLCQLSGLIHYLALHTDFEVLERHSHSKDIYTDDTRFAPLGSDATVVYGYKDLRIKNQTETPIRFQFELYKTHITATIMSLDAIPAYDVEFLVSDRPHQKCVRTIRHKPHSRHPELYGTTVYSI
ncbi:VanW family protein [filamentous cyanobacterium LEGE 11480]|uniref:VanW family protein n=1 Tax=Romeriopsis navalis LEGE 11480 TaxID=2777977 RepID=A0A928Z4X3_9CYAN|nr:VanW family protein [Romeriopsis navalis]MBE9030650.1 VanW family protein [Romeriopsis navalis LEGE 11480]